VSRPAVVSPVPQAPGLRVALVVSTYHDGITGRLAGGALEALAAAGVSASDIERLEVPGAYEIPFGARTAAASGRVDAVVCLGCLIKGETPHFDYIASAVSHGIMQASLTLGVPMAFGVLTVNTMQEAEARVVDGPANKGYEAAVAVITMAGLARAWQPARVPQGAEG
jgi:6,7-dimethyl-8-ribityllumazine synthase